MMFLQIKGANGNFFELDGEYYGDFWGYLVILLLVLGVRWLLIRAGHKAANREGPSELTQGYIIGGAILLPLVFWFIIKLS